MIPDSILNDDERREMADRVIEASRNCRFDEDMQRLKAQEETFNNLIGAELLMIQGIAKRDNRDRLHADEQRRVDRLKRDRDEVSRAVLLAERCAAENARVWAEKLASAKPPAGSRESSDWKTVLPSMIEFRAASINNDPSGGYIVHDEIGPFVDRLRPSSAMLSAGPRIEPCDSDALILPGLASSVTVYPTGEAGSITESSPGFQQVRIPMKKYAIYTLGSSEWFSDATPGARQVVEMDHRMKLAADLDLDMLQGNGSGNRLQGLRYQGTATSLGANGATPTLSNIVDAIYRLEANNAKPSAIFMHPRTWNTLRKLVDGQSRYQLAPTPAEAAPKNLFGLPVFLSSQISITETIGSSTDCSWIAVADMSRIVVAQRQDMVVLYDPYTYSKNDQVAIRTTTRWGLGVLDVAAVEVLTGVRP